MPCGPPIPGLWDAIQMLPDREAPGVVRESRRCLTSPGSTPKGYTLRHPTMKPTSSRIAYLDNLRILVTILVVLHHVAITYGAPGDWYFYDTPVSELGIVLLTIFVALNASFFMGLFFLLAGYFTPRSRDRKGSVRFLGGRLIRLGIPLAVFSLLLDPLIRATLTVRVWSPGSRFWPAFVSYASDLSFTPGPLWFVTALLIFATTYTVLGAAAARVRRSRPSRPLRLTNRKIVVFGLLIGLTTFVVRVFIPSGETWFVFQLGDFAQYIALYVAGVLAYRHGWFDRLTPRDGRRWRWAAIGIALALPAIGFLGGAFDGDPSEYLGGFRWESLLGSLWWAMEGVAIAMALLTTFKERLSRQTSIAREAARCTYGVYVLHAPIVVSVSLFLLPTGLNPSIKLLLTACISVAACFVVAAGLRRIPLVNRIL